MPGIEMGWGLQWVLWFQSWRTPLVEALFLPFHYLGTEDAYFLILPLVYWCIDARFGRRLAYVFLLNVWLNSWLKAWAARPRPYQVSDAVRNVITETSNGIPSGHAQFTTALWGTIGVALRRRIWAVILIAVYIILMGISRIVLGVHFPQDVAAGWLLGLLAVVLYVTLDAPISAWLSNQGIAVQLALAVVVALVPLVIHPLWIPAANAAALATAITPAGALLGGGIGMVIETRYVRFDARGVWWKRLLRLVIGLVVVFGLRLGLGALFEGASPEVLFRLLRYTVIGLWLTLAAPWLFVRIGLASRTEAL